MFNIFCTDLHYAIPGIRHADAGIRQWYCKQVSYMPRDLRIFHSVNVRMAVVTGEIKKV